MTAIAETILDQLGRNRFIAMTGAKNFVGGSNYLSFRVSGALTKNRVNYIKITLNGNDLYDIECCVVRGMDVKTKSHETDIYNENLCQVFTSLTGLYTRF